MPIAPPSPTIVNQWYGIINKPQPTTQPVLTFDDIDVGDEIEYIINSDVYCGTIVLKSNMFFTTTRIPNSFVIRTKTINGSPIDEICDFVTDMRLINLTGTKIIKKAQKENSVCKCNILISGCKCGVFQAEQAKKQP